MNNRIIYFNKGANCVEIKFKKYFNLKSGRVSVYRQYNYNIKLNIKYQINYYTI